MEFGLLFWVVSDLYDKQRIILIHGRKAILAMEDI